jgi:hypothetical protein
MKLFKTVFIILSPILSVSVAQASIFDGGLVDAAKEVGGEAGNVVEYVGKDDDAVGGGNGKKGLCFRLECSTKDERKDKARQKLKDKGKAALRKRAEREYNRQNKQPLGSKSSKMHQQKMKLAEHRKRYEEINDYLKHNRDFYRGKKDAASRSFKKDGVKRARKMHQKEDKAYQKWIDADPAAFEMYRKDLIKREQRQQKIARAIAERIRKEKAVANEIAGQKFLKANAIRIKKLEAELKARTERNFARQRQEALQKIKDREAFNMAITARMVKKQGEERLTKEKAAKKRH